MRRHIAGLLMLGATVASGPSGCGPEGATGSLGTPTPEGPTIINVDEAANDSLPSLVDRAAQSAAKIILHNSNSHIVVSAAAVEGGYLTAGHAFQLPGCQQGMIYRTEDRGASRELSEATAIDEHNPAHGVDIAFVRSAGGAALKTADLSYRNKDLDVGTEVYFVNFEPAPDGELRGPEQSGNHKSPAIFAGRVLQDPAGDAGKIVILSGIGPSYGAIPDIEARSKASGGPVFMEDGTDIGILDANAEVATSQIEKDYGVHILGKHVRGEYSLIYVQPVNEQKVDALAKRLRPLC